MTTGREELDRFRSQYGLTDVIPQAIQRWRETNELQRTHGPRTLGPHATALRADYVKKSLEALKDHNAAESELSLAEEAEHVAIKEAGEGNGAAAPTTATAHRQACEQRVNDAWRLFEQLNECVEVLSSTYAHFDEALNRESRALTIALDGVSEGITYLETFERELASQSALPWYRRGLEGRRGIEESLIDDPRAHILDTRHGTDPMVLLLIVRHLLERHRVVSPQSVKRPEKAGLNRVVVVLSRAGVGTAELCRVLADLGYDPKNEASADNVRRIRREHTTPEHLQDAK